MIDQPVRNGCKCWKLERCPVLLQITPNHCRWQICSTSVEGSAKHMAHCDDVAIEIQLRTVET